MADKNVKESKNQVPENNNGYDINADESLSGSTHLNEPVEEESALEKLNQELNPEFPFSYQFADEEYGYLYKSEQVVQKLSGYFAFLAIFISCLGLLGLVLFTAEQRNKEIGIRKVLGASVLRILKLLYQEFATLLLIAFVIAVPLAWLTIGNWLQGYAFRISIHWSYFLIPFVSILIIALLTVSFQSIKAAIANPVKSLRTE